MSGKYEPSSVKYAISRTTKGITTALSLVVYRCGCSCLYNSDGIAQVDHCDAHLYLASPDKTLDQMKKELDDMFPLFPQEGDTNENVDD